MFKKKTSKDSSIDSKQGNNYDSTGTSGGGDHVAIPVVTGTAVDDEQSLQQQQQQNIAENERNLLDLNPTVTEPLPVLKTDEQAIYKLLKKGQYVMDESITLPFINRKIGLDPIVGLVPVIGDFASSAVSLSMVAMAAPVLSKYTVTRMLINVYIDTLIGLVPFIGDIFDIGWKANSRNVKIFEDHMTCATSRRNADRKFIWTAVICFILFLLFTTIAFVVIILLIVLWLVGYFN